MDDENNKNITLVVKNVSPEARYMLNEICAIYGYDRGEYLSELFKKEAYRVFGEYGFEQLEYEFSAIQDANEKEKMKNSSNQNSIELE